MKLANPLHYPLAVLVGAIALVAGVRLARVPAPIALPLSAAIAVGGAIVLKSKEPEAPTLENPELEQDLQRIRQQAKNLADKATALRQEATRLLTSSLSMDLLVAVQYACDRASELPTKINALAQRMKGADSLLEVTDLQQQLAAVEYKLRNSSGVAQAQLTRLAESLHHNIQLAQQGQDARQAQVASLLTVILDAAGMLQDLQNKLRTTDLTDVNETSELRSLSDEFKTAQETVDLLVSKS